MTDRECICHKDYKSLATEQLDALLQAELQKEIPDETVVVPILDELEERECSFPVSITHNVSAAWDNFQQKAVPENKKRRPQRWLAGSAVAAAFLIFVLLTIPGAANAEGFIGAVARWTASIFEFLSPDANTQPTEIVFETDNEGLQQLYDMIVGYGVTEPVVPMWLPEGYQLKEIKATPLQDAIKVYAKFLYNNRGIIFTYIISEKAKSIEYEKSDAVVEIFETAGAIHYFVQNADHYSALWYLAGVECKLATELDKEGALEIIRSIYRSVS